MERVTLPDLLNRMIQAGRAPEVARATERLAVANSHLRLLNAELHEQAVEMGLELCSYVPEAQLPSPKG